MRRQRLQLHQGDLWKRLAPDLLNRVFHVTSHVAAERILAGEGIRHNQAGEFVTVFGSSENSYFRKRGCVPVFDLRNPYENPDNSVFGTMEQTRTLILAAALKTNLAFLFLAEDCVSLLVPWTAWQDEQVWSDRIVPHAEAGYPGIIPVDMIKEVLFVKVKQRGSKQRLP